jgi:hypothetical protein
MPIACLGVRIPIPISINHFRYILYVRAHRIIIKAVSEMFLEDTIDGDAPGLESHYKRCRTVDKQGERHEDHLGDIDHGIDGVEGIRLLEARSELEGRCHDRCHVNDWNDVQRRGRSR